MSATERAPKDLAVLTPAVQNFLREYPGHIVTASRIFDLDRGVVARLAAASSVAAAKLKRAHAECK